jgi:hypothetical protein
MKRLLVLPLVLLITTCTAYNAQHGDGDAAPAPAAPRNETAAAKKPAPAPAVQLASNKIDARQAMLVSEIDKYMNELAANGQYDCCVKPACRQCAITAGECHCREVISRDGPCCGECTQSWVEGRGNTEGVDREQVLAHLGCVRELYEKKVPEGMTPPGQKKPSAGAHEHH